MNKKLHLPTMGLILLLLGCTSTVQAPTATDTSIPEPPTTEPTEVLTEVVFDLDNTENGLFLVSGGDVDTEVITVGSPEEQALRTGNGSVLHAADGNTDADYFMQFRIVDDFIFGGEPTTRVKIEVEYLDVGTDTFSIQYDALAGEFTDTGLVLKTDTGEFKTATFSLCDAYFANRDNGADFRIADSADGAETILRVRVILPTASDESVTIHVDSYGANPFDDQPDSEAIQACIDQMCSGDTALFTSGVDSPDYRGYVIDKTVFLERKSAKSGLTFSSTDPQNHALLRASSDLLGFVVRLFARSSTIEADNIDNITISHLDLDGNRAERKCYGADGTANSTDDNWGSWLSECEVFNDAWCSPGTLAMVGNFGSSGLIVEDLRILETECGTALNLIGSASIIRDTTIDTAGDHVHEPGCEPTDPDEALSAWSDGITFEGPDILITNNLIMDASDIGIVTFGGRDTIISNNTIIARPGNNGMFAAIAVSPYHYGVLSGCQVVGNTVTNEADPACGGIHAGIYIGTHMWSAGCMYGNAKPNTVGDPTGCSSVSPPPGLMFCVSGQPCRSWGYIPEGETLTLTDNTVTGAQVNFLVEGLEVLGELIVSGNVSNAPQMTDWTGSANCTWDGITDSWGPLDFVAHDPTIEGWTDQRIYCER